MIVAGRIAVVVEADVVELRVAHVEIKERNLARFPGIISCGGDEPHGDAIDVDANFAVIIHVEGLERNGGIPRHGLEAIEDIVRMRQITARDVSVGLIGW